MLRRNFLWVESVFLTSSAKGWCLDHFDLTIVNLKLKGFISKYIF